jgi:O-acetyl-ADP-ribose deacetylase (regulator of RNase III)
MDEARLTGHYRYKLLYLAGSLIGFESGNLATFDKGAIVNSRSDDTASGLDEALRRAGGPAFRAACEAIGPLGVGIAAVTGAGGLLASAVLHVRVPDWRGGSSGEAEALASCYEACLETAIRNGYRHVAFPLLGSGGRGFPLMLAARIGLESIARQLISGPARIGVTFVIPDQSVLEAVRSLLP